MDSTGWRTVLSGGQGVLGLPRPVERDHRDLLRHADATLVERPQQDRPQCGRTREHRVRPLTHPAICSPARTRLPACSHGEHRPGGTPRLRHAANHPAWRGSRASAWPTKATRSDRGRAGGRWPGRHRSAGRCPHSRRRRAAETLRSTQGSPTGANGLAVGDPARQDQDAVDHAGRELLEPRPEPSRAKVVAVVESAYPRSRATDSMAAANSAKNGLENTGSATSGTARTIVRAEPDRSARAAWFGRYPSWATAARTPRAGLRRDRGAAVQRVADDGVRDPRPAGRRRGGWACAGGPAGSRSPVRRPSAPRSSGRPCSSGRPRSCPSPVDHDTRSTAGRRSPTATGASPWSGIVSRSPSRLADSNAIRPGSV